MQNGSRTGTSYSVSPALRAIKTQHYYGGTSVAALADAVAEGNQRSKVPPRFHLKQCLCLPAISLSKAVEGLNAATEGQSAKDEKDQIEHSRTYCKCQAHRIPVSN